MQDTPPPATPCGVYVQQPANKTLLPQDIFKNKYTSFYLNNLSSMSGFLTLAKIILLTLKNSKYANTTTPGTRDTAIANGAASR